MPSRHLALPMLIAALASQAPFDVAHAAQRSMAAPTTPISAPATIPDEARVASHLRGHFRFETRPGAGTEPYGSDGADETAIRSTVRKGDVLEFLVTSVYHATKDGQPQREVDSIVSYRQRADGWTLFDIQPSATRAGVPNATNASGDC